MICQKCGAKIEDDSVFCVNCHLDTSEDDQRTEVIENSEVYNIYDCDSKTVLLSPGEQEFFENLLDKSNDSASEKNI